MPHVNIIFHKTTYEEGEKFELGRLRRPESGPGSPEPSFRQLPNQECHQHVEKDISFAIKQPEH